VSSQQLISPPKALTAGLNKSNDNNVKVQALTKIISSRRAFSHLNRLYHLIFSSALSQGIVRHREGDFDFNHFMFHIFSRATSIHCTLFTEHFLPAALAHTPIHQLGQWAEDEHDGENLASTHFLSQNHFPCVSYLPDMVKRFRSGLVL
jgi:hypothetical protein